MRIPFHTTLQKDGETQTVVDAVANIDTGTGKPAKVTGDVAKPLIKTGKVEVLAAAVTEVQFSTVSAHRHLVGDFTTITDTAAQTDTDGLAIVLSIGCKGQTHHSNQNE